MGKRIIAVVIVVASACTALHYSTTEQHVIAISNNPHTFNGSGSQTFVVSSGSADHDVLVSIAMVCSSQWTLITSLDPQQPVMGAHVCGSGPGSGSGSTTTTIVCPANYTFAVNYAGTTPGTSSCDVVVTSMPYNGGSATQVETLRLQGIGSGSTGIEVMPSSIDFKGIQINTTSTPATQVTVKNVGSASVSVTGSLTGGAFQVTPNPATPLGIGPGSSATFGVTCTPPAVAPYSGTLTFTTGTSTGTTTLACSGINSMVNIAPTQVTFANTLVGRAPPQKSIMLTGAPSATIETVELDVDAIAAGVTIVTNPQGMALGSGQTVTLAYSAAAMHAAGPLGTLSIKVSTDATARPVGISGQALLGGVGTNPASVDFGAVCTGGSAMESIEVYASEPGDVVVSQLTKPATPFDAMLVDTLPKTLAGNHAGPSATVRVTFAPKDPGAFVDAIALTSDVPNMATTEVQLEGIGVAGGIGATPNMVHFGVAAPGSTTAIKEVQLTNCGTSELMFTRAVITGLDANEFVLIGANPPRTLLPTESEIFMVVMQPDSGGFKSAQLVLEHSAGMTAVDLDGTGDGSGVGDKERETYYACSTGHRSSLWPLALALLLLRRRRR